MIATEILNERVQKIQRWVVEPDRSTVEFTVRHAWGMSSVSGRFDRFGGWYVMNHDTTSLELSVDPASVDTGNAMRDKHLRASDFFDVERHPSIRFTSTSISEEDDGRLHVIGVLDVAGTQVAVGLDATTRQVGNEIEFEASGTVDQRDFGMSSGPLWSIRPPTAIHVKARLVPSTGLFGEDEEGQRHDLTAA